MSISEPSGGVAGPDALLPPAMADKAEAVGVQKAGMEFQRLFALAFLAGAFIALGAAFSTTVGAAGDPLPWGLARFLFGISFSLGLILVVVGGAELFTGNMLIVMAWAARKVPGRALLRNWTVSYIGNFVGAAATATVVFLSGQYRYGGGEVGALALRIAERKLSLGIVEAVALGALCNVLVCLAIWMTLSARSTTDKVMVILPPITAFAACGFEHSIANMYFVPIAMWIGAAAPDAFWQEAGLVAEDFNGLDWDTFIFGNLLPVTIGNIIGGAAMVAVVYWAIYLRQRRA